MDFTARSTDEMKALYPSMKTNTRIAVVGGGPSGLSAAYELVKLGYKNVTVLEQHSKVGGMCGSELIEGRVYDLGGQVIARESSPTVVSMMTQLGVELEAMGHHTMSRIDCLTGKMEEMKIVADCLSLLPVTSKLQAKANVAGKLGVHAVSSIAHELAPEYLKSNGSGKGVPRAVAALFTASGYGYPQDMPYAYIHEFLRSSLGQAWRVKCGYSSFWEKVANLLPDVRCNVHVQGIQRSGQMVQISTVESTTRNTDSDIAAGTQEETLEFDKVILSGSVSIPRGNRIYRSSDSSQPEIGKLRGILDYTKEELEVFSKVETIDYYTTVLKISGLDIPAVFYYPEHADDPASMGRFVAMQRFYADTDIFLFWSFGTAEVQQQRVTELLYEDVEKLGGRVETLILQRKWRYFPHVRSSDMKAGFYDKLEELQGKNNIYYTGALMAFELTERNTAYSIGLVKKCFGSTTEPFFVKRLVEYPLPNGAEEVLDYKPNDLTELPGLEFPDLSTVDAYLSFYAKHPVTKDRVVFTWIDNEGKESSTLTFSQLDTRASIIAHHLLTSKKPALQPGDRVVLLHPPGLDFIEAFLACLRARILAVPLIPPDPTKRAGDQALEKLINVVKITNSRAIISTRAYHSVVRASSISFLKTARLKWPDLPWIHSNHLNDSRYLGAKASERASHPWTALVRNAVTKLAATSLGLNMYPSSGSQPSTPLDLLEARGVNLSEQGNSSDEETTDDHETVVVLKPHQRTGDGAGDGARGEQNGFGAGAAGASQPNLNDVCFLQFTSGSTGDAKGVMITHGALIHNTKSMRAAYKSTARSVVVSWLPQYHDMGLIGGLLVSLVTGGSLVIFSPITFIRKPMMWLDMVEKYKATHTAAPNFGFELVLKRYEMLKASGRAKQLDLSSLRFLMVGAEPISAQTMRGFVETFWDAGVREEIFAPGFGMAENCVFICCAFGRNRPMLMDYHGRVGCGYTDKSRGKGVRCGTNPHSAKLPEEWKDSCSDVRIVNPDSLEEVGDGVEGEIWLSSPSNGVGYWEMPEATKQTFRAQLKGASSEDADILFVRSGDLGRVIENNLFVTGRIKDLIIVNGRNYYPSDIEKTVENCSPSLKPGCSAAFSAPARVLQSKGVVTSEADGIVVVVEVRDEKKMRKDAADLLVSHVKAVVSEQHGLQVAYVNLIKPRSIAKTTSGKIRRRECLKRFSEGTLSSMKGSANLSMIRAYSRVLRRPTQVAPSAPFTSQAQTAKNGAKTKDEITSFLIHLVAETTGMSRSRINESESFENYSIDSQGTVAAASKLSEFLGTHISAIQIYTTGCISELADFCEDVVKKLDSRGEAKASTRKSLDHDIQPTVAVPIPSIVSQTTPNGAEQPPISHGVEYEQHDAEEISEAQLADALDPSQKRKIAITALQILAMLYMGALLITPAVYIYEKLISIVAPGDLSSSLSTIVVLSAALVPLAWILLIAFTAIVLSTFGARVLLPMNQKSQPSSIPLWSPSYVRWWTLYRVQEFASNSLAGYLRGTVFLTYWYRSLGAEIDDGVLLDTVDITDPALLSVGSGAVIGEGATIQSHEVNSGLVTFQSVRIGRGCVVGPYAVVQRGSVLDPGSGVSALGKTEVGERLFSSTKQGQIGSQGKQKSPPLTTTVISQLSGLYLVGLVSTLSALVAYKAFQWLGAQTEVITDSSLMAAVTELAPLGYLFFPLLLTFPRYLMILSPLMMFPNPALLVNVLLHITRERNVMVFLSVSGVAFMVYGATLAVFTCALKWSLIGRLQEGSSSHSEGFKYRLWLVHALLRSAHEKFMVLLMGTETLCIYLRSLGANVGRMASIRRLNALIDPDLLQFGEECHLGDFSKIITSQNLSGGMISLGAVRIGGGCVVGAQSVVMPGATLQNRAVLGAMSVAPTGAVLEEGGVYVGVKTPVKIFQQLPSTIGEHEQKSKNSPGSKLDSEPSEEEEHPLVAVGKALDPRFRQMIASVAAEFVKKTPRGHARYIHFLGSAGKGTMRVLDTLPKGFPQHDILTPGATYPIVLRCSNGVSKDDDRCTEVRGGTLRLLQPDSPDDLTKPLLDLFMKTGTIFHARNMVEFLGYYIMTEAERDARIRQFPALGDSQWGNMRRPNSYAEMHYFCCTARHFQALPSSSSTSTTSDKMYVKFKIRPQDSTLEVDEGSVQAKDGELPPISGMYPADEDDQRSKSYLRDDFKSRLESPEGVRFVLQLQLHPIPASTKEREEVEDPTQVWDEETYPYMDVAELCFDEPVDDTLFDDIHFNPKHGPPSLAMIRGTSAMQSASVDTGRSVMHDLLGYLRSGTPLPPLWNDLVKKSFNTDLTPAPPPPPAGAKSDETNNIEAQVGVLSRGACPMSTGSGSQAWTKILQEHHHGHGPQGIDDVYHESNSSEISKPSSSSVTSSDRETRSEGVLRSKRRSIVSDGLQTRDLCLIRFIQPILQMVVPMALLTLSLFPSLLALGSVGTMAGAQWMYGLLPVAYFCSSLLFAMLGVVCKWIISWKINDGQAHELWSATTLRHTVWDAINQTIASTCLELGKGSAFCAWYLQGLGASIEDSSVYIDTLHALNPDQLRVGVRSVMGHNTLVFGHLYEGKKVAFKSNCIGDDTVIGTRALLLPGLKMEDGAQLEALGLGMKDEIIRADFQ